MAFTTEQARVYQKQRYDKRLIFAREYLGGKCVRCGATEKLQFDHIVPGSRACIIPEATNWSMARFLGELDKCQLLCGPCHREKTTESGEWAHGEKNGKAKLTEDGVRLIRASHLSQQKLASIFAVSGNCIWKIRQRKTWKHVI